MDRATASQGFTLLEMLTVVTLLGIFASIAVPSFTSLVNQTRTRSAADALFGLLLQARSEAVLRRTTVTICTSDTLWRSVLGDCDSSDATSLRQVTLPPSQVTAQPSRTNLSYSAEGTALMGTDARVTVVLCHGGDATKGYKVDIQRNGVTRQYPMGKADAAGTALTSCRP
ncbi:GspH/FimT family pseudopilin [Pseudomonas benzopyrenica]|uniref:Type II secretion system protein H n=1 Tax=Pseudomonas benzopyrenica TaxID=2993566 RepID=A0ABZ2FPQ3_9PSED